MIFAACLLLAAALLGYTFFAGGKSETSPEKTRLMYLQERKDVIYENLRDLSFEFKSGKFPQVDYESTRGDLEEEAARVLSEISALEGASR